MRPFLRCVSTLILALVVAAFAGRPAAAQESAPFTWARYDVELSLRPDGTFDVAETQVLDLRGTLRRGYREIPLSRVSGITEVSVEEPGRPYVRGSDRPYTFAATRTDDGTIRVDWWFPPQTGGTKTFVLRYRVDGGIRVYEGGDQLYWTAVYADRAAPVASSTVTLRFPSAVAPDQTRLATYPERLDASAQLRDDRTAIFSATNIPPASPFEVRAQFPHGLVDAEPPGWQAAADFADWYDTTARPVLNFLALLATLAVLALGAAGLAGLWFARGRDPAVGAVPRIVDQPPSDLPAGMVGTLVDERADVQDVVATLVDLANRGYISMTEERDPGLAGSSLDYRLELLKPDLIGLRPYEKTVLGTLFRGDERAARLSALKDRFTNYIPLFQDQLHAEVARERLFQADPEGTRRRYRRLGTILVVIGLVGGALALFILSAYVDLAVVPFVALLAVGVAARWLASHMPARTRIGALEAARWRAFGRFLREAKPPPEAASTPRTAEQWLPYAVALGVDQRWVQNIASVGTPPPRWYGRRVSSRVGGGPDIVFMPSPWGWGGGGTIGHGDVGSRDRGGTSDGGAWSAPTGQGGLSPGGPQDWSDSLSDLLNRASDVLSHGGGSGWSGGGWGGGGGSGGGGSGGGGGGFS